MRGNQVFLSRGAAIGFLEEGVKIWQVAAKISRDATETCLTTLHRAQPRDIVVAMRKYKRIQGR